MGLTVGEAAAGVEALPSRIAAGEPGFRLAPQCGQNAKSASDGIPHARQWVGCRRPQRGQKMKLGESSKPQPVQVIAMLRCAANLDSIYPCAVSIDALA